MTYEASNMTNQEYYRLNGTLSQERIEGLLELAKLAAIDVDPLPYIEEIKPNLPEEDFLQTAINRLKKIAATTRGLKRDNIDEIIIDLEDIQSETARKCEYVIEQIDNATDDINEINQILEQL